MRKDDLQFILDTYGLKHQSLKCVEEMSELIKVLCKWWDWDTPNKDIRDNVIEELADVQITINQVILGFNIGDMVDEQIDYKIQRQLDRIGGKRKHEP